MTFVWAHGQSGKEFYKDDELKYHGNPKADTVITRGSKGEQETKFSKFFSMIKSTPSPRVMWFPITRNSTSAGFLLMYSVGLMRNSGRYAEFHQNSTITVLRALSG